VPEDGVDSGKDVGCGEVGDVGAGFAAGGWGLALGPPHEKAKLKRNNRMQARIL